MPFLDIVLETFQFNSFLKIAAFLHLFLLQFLFKFLHHWPNGTFR